MSTKMTNTQMITTLVSRMDTLEKLLTSLVSERPALPAQSKPEKVKKERKPRDPDAPQSAWIQFTGRIRTLLSGNGYSAGPENAMFCSFLKNQKPMGEWTDAEILSARSGWTRPEHSKLELSGKSKRKSNSSGASVASAPASAASGEEPKKRKSRFDSMTPEEAAAEKAKIAARLKAGREAKKAAAAASAPAPSAPPADAGYESDASFKTASDAPAESAGASVSTDGSKRRGRPAGSKNKPKTEEEKAAAKAKRDAKKTAEHDGRVFSVMKINKVAYLVDRENNGAYLRDDDGGLGDWAGRYDPSTKKIDVSVNELD